MHQQYIFFLIFIRIYTCRSSEKKTEKKKKWYSTGAFVGVFFKKLATRLLR
jgi:Na+(H+)/acetate symporter ActP